MRPVEIGPIEIAETYPHATDVQLADGTLRNRLEVLVKKLNRNVWQRSANGDLFHIDLDFRPGGADRGFRWSVLIPHGLALGGKSPGQTEWKGLPAHRDPHACIALPSSFEEQSIHGRRAKHHGRC